MDVFWQAPPVTRTLAAASLVVSALGYGGMIPLMPLIFQSSKLWTFPPEIWRLATAFLITGPKLSIILDPFFLYRYGSGLESGSPRFSQPGDFFTYTVFCMAGIVITAGFGLGSAVFMSALTLAFAYTYSQDNPNANVHFFIINFQAKYLPWAMLLVAFIMNGPGAAVEQFTGILAAHMYDFLTRIWPAFGGGSREPWVKTPWVIAKAFGADSPAHRVREYGIAQPARRDEPAAAGRATATAWNVRGPGRRLG